MTAADQPTTEPSEVETAESDVSKAVDRAVGEVLFNVSNDPRKAQGLLLGVDTGPLREKVVDAVLAVLTPAPQPAADTERCGFSERGRTCGKEKGHDGRHRGEGYRGVGVPSAGTERDERLRGARKAVQDALSHPTLWRSAVSQNYKALDGEITRLDAVVAAVREVHQPEAWDNDLEGTSGVACSTCVDGNREAITYPCPTVRALDGGAS